MQQLTMHKNEIGINIGFRQSEDISAGTTSIYTIAPGGSLGSAAELAGTLESTTAFYFTTVDGTINTAGTWYVYGKVIEATQTRWCGPVELYVLDTP